MPNPLWGSKERPTPSMAEYVKALQKIQPSDQQRSMLRANLIAPDSTITAGEMTRQVFNVDGHTTANMHYGALAGKLASALNIKIPNDEQAVNFLVAFGHGNDGDAVWTLHSNLAEALRRFHI